MSKDSNTNSGIGVVSLYWTGVTFVTLKLCNVIDWNWWYVTAPFWVPIVIALVILLGWFILLMTFGGKRW